MGEVAGPSCPICKSPRIKMADDIIKRLGRDPSFAELWARLDEAERDRNRMLNALQWVRDQKAMGRITLPPHAMTIINRALSKVEPRMIPQPPTKGPRDE